MDDTFAALINLYEDMLCELRDEVTALGGYVKDFSPETSKVNIVIDPKLQSYAEEYIADLLIRYDRRRNTIMCGDAFIGVKLLLFHSEQGN